MKCVRCFNTARSTSLFCTPCEEAEDRAQRSCDELQAATEAISAVQDASTREALDHLLSLIRGLKE